MTKSYSFFDNALNDATILATGETFDKKERQDELKGLYRDCYRDGFVKCEGFTIKRTLTETCSVVYFVTFNA